jgi:sortase A
MTGRAGFAPAGHRRLRLWLKWIGSLLIFSGVALLVWPGVEYVRALRFQRQASAYLNQVAESHAVQPKRVIHFPEGAVIGRIDIPRVEVSTVILEGDDAALLRLGAGHIPGTALPGDGGNVALAAHRDTFFRGLRKIRKNDQILLTTPWGVDLYKVSWTRVVSPEDVKVLDGVGRPVLTLVTCYPFSYIGPAPERFIVRAVKVGAGGEPLSPPSQSNSRPRRKNSAG